MSGRTCMDTDDVRRLLDGLRRERDEARAALDEARDALAAVELGEPTRPGFATEWDQVRAVLARTGAGAACSCEARGKEPHEDWCERSEWSKP